MIGCCDVIVSNERDGVSLLPLSILRCDNILLGLSEVTNSAILWFNRCPFCQVKYGCKMRNISPSIDIELDSIIRYNRFTD